MFFGLEWYIIVRTINIVLSILGMLLLGYSYHRDNRWWSVHKKDVWYALFVWQVVGIVASIEGLLRHEGATVRMILILVATLVGMRGVVQLGREPSSS